MPPVEYILPDGTARTVDVPSGQSVMEGSVRHNLPGIVAECGGSCSCATCHVYLDEASRAQFAEASDEERELLAFADGSTPDSRLACQLILTGTCTGVRVTVAGTNG